MLLAVTLVSPDPKAAKAAVPALAEAVARLAGAVKDSRELGPGAIDLAVEGAAPGRLRKAAQAAVEGVPVDVCVQPQANRRKRLLVADMDSTIIGCECLDELADFAGLKVEISAITERAMRGEIGFEGALRQRVAMLEGLSVKALERCYEERVRLNPGARTMVATMAAHGARCVLVSGGFDFFTNRVAALAGFDLDRSNRLIEADGVLSGAVAEPILGREAKLATLNEQASALGIPLSLTVAIGDGANDLDMIGAAGLGVAYRAKPLVAAEADARIDHADLTALLYFQGYSQAEFQA